MVTPELRCDSPAFAKRLPKKTERNIDRKAYRVELVQNRLEWVTREGDVTNRA